VAEGAGPRRLGRQDPRLPGLADGQVTAAAYSVGMTFTEDMQAAILKVPAPA